MNGKISFPSFSQAQSKPSSIDKVSQPDFKRALVIEGRQETDDAVSLNLGEEAEVVSPSYTKRAKPSVQQADIAVQPKKEPARVADVEAKKPEESSNEVQGVYKDGFADFGGFAVQIGQNGEVNAIIRTPEGKEIRGKGTRDRDGRTVVSFDNGQTYAGTLTIKGDRATVSDVRLVEQAEGGDAPSASDEESDLQVAPG